jgi:membrane protein DedA with SNARE-associated domain
MPSTTLAPRRARELLHTLEVIVLDSMWTFLVAHAYAVVFVGVLVDATGTPFPGRLLLITAGGIAATGGANVLLLICLAVVAALLGDHVWYLAGRLGGDRVVRLYCRVVLLGATPCVERAKAYFARFGPGVFIVGRFVAGVRIVVTPLAASSGMPYRRYVLYDAIGAAVWATVWILLGFLLGDQWIAWTKDGGAATISAVLTGASVLAVAGAVAYRLWQRQRAARRPA